MTLFGIKTPLQKPMDDVTETYMLYLTAKIDTWIQELPYSYLCFAETSRLNNCNLFDNRKLCPHSLMSVVVVCKDFILNCYYLFIFVYFIDKADEFKRCL